MRDLALKWSYMSHLLEKLWDKNSLAIKKGCEMWVEWGFVLDFH
jgi:hypothetical protein